MTLLRSRSTVDHVFISPSCRALVPFADWDNNKSVAVKDTDGTMSGMVSACYALLTSFFFFLLEMIDFLNKTDKNDILVTIDYAGLTTDPDDMFQFVRYTLGVMMYNSVI